MATQQQTASGSVGQDFVEDFVARWLAAWNSHQAEQVLGMMGEDVVYDDSAWPRTMHGHADVREFLAHSWRAFPDMRFELADGPFLHPSEPRAAFHWRGDATHLGPIDPPGLALRAAERLSAVRPALRRVINATGVLLHTGLGRSPLAAEAVAAVAERARTSTSTATASSRACGSSSTSPTACASWGRCRRPEARASACRRGWSTCKIGFAASERQRSPGAAVGDPTAGADLAGAVGARP